MDKADLRAIADGRQPRPWSATFTHPAYGELTFKAQLPRATALAAQSLEMDNLLGGLIGEPRMNTILLCSAIAGMKTLIELPVVREERAEDPDDPSHVKITRVVYDPEQEFDEKWLVDVWMAFSEWRGSFLLGAVDALPNSSGETSGDASDDPSSEPSDSPSTTPGSPAGPTPTT